MRHSSLNRTRKRRSVNNYSSNTLRRQVAFMGRYVVDSRSKEVMNGTIVIPFHKKMLGEDIQLDGNHLVIDGYKLTSKNKWRKISLLERLFHL